MEWLLLAVGLVLILGTAFFVAVEFCFVALDVTSVQRAVDSGDTHLKPLLKCLRTLSTQLSAVQLGITLTTLLTGYVIEPSLGKLLKPLFDGMGLNDATSGATSLVVAMIVATFLSMLLGELIPKNLVIAEPLRIGRYLAGPQLVFTAVFKPIVLLLNGFANKVLHLMGIEAKEELSGARTPAELSSLLKRSAQLGTVEADTARFLERTLVFGERSAADVMTPRIRMETVQAEDPLDEVIETARRSGYSRFLVIDESPDEVRGVVHVKKAVSVPRDRRDELVAATIMSDVASVPETVHLDDLIGVLRTANLQMAVVLDEYGGTAGMVTLEDLVEEIVGDVADEHDRRPAGVLQSADGSWFFPGLLRPDEATEQIPGLVAEEGPDYETMGGLIMTRLGRIPDRGDEVASEGGVLRVSAMDGFRVDRIEFVPDAPQQPTPSRPAEVPSAAADDVAGGAA
ncbi:MAG: hemolysin family protein [Galactobacter sp.]|uniref:hemolysin family protein n=1 Tax=Galactobacter sp. TaxID=2676125 RepID=UPI0025BD72BD|nr:hemolysin family protein [Galactobacter sp.]